MKKFLIISLFGFLFFSTPFSTWAEGTQSIVPLTFDTLYVPSGFDSNDNVQLVGEGFFRNACFSLGPTRVFVDQIRKLISVHPQAYVYEGPCAQVVHPNVILPFVTEINVGALTPGTYRIFQGPYNSPAGHISVAQAVRSSVDEYSYAPISNVDIQQVGDVTEIHLSGFMLGSCVRLGPVKTYVENNVITVIPYAYSEPGDHCLRGRFPFSVTVRVRAPEGRYLVHVRSQNGEALNRVVDARYINVITPRNAPKNGP